MSRELLDDIIYIIEVGWGLDGPWQSAHTSFLALYSVSMAVFISAQSKDRNGTLRTKLQPGIL